jgi:sugar porter (SP) family MFS transporter
MTAALGGLLYGYDTGVISGALLYLKHDLGVANNGFLQGLITAAILIGAMIGALSGGALADRTGRRKLTLYAAVIFAIGAVGSALSPDVAVIILFRVVLGIGVGFASVVVPMYISEISPTAVRGRYTSIYQLMITIGILVAYLIDYGLSSIQAWRLMLGLALIPAVVLFAAMLGLPETPRWLIKHGQVELAKKVLHKTRPPGEIEEELAGIQEAEHQEQHGAGWGVLTKPWMRPALGIGFGLTVLQQFVGINTIIYYAPTTLSQLGFGSSASILGEVGIGVVNVIFTFVAIRYMDRWGRKPLLITGSVGMAVSLGVLAGLTLAEGLTGGAIGVITIICLAAYIAFFAATWGPTVWVMLPEIFPLRVRGPAEGSATWGNWAANFVVSLTFPVILLAIGNGFSMLIFAIISALSLLFLAKVLPETKGRSLEQLEADLYGEPVSTQSSEPGTAAGTA